MPSQTKRPWKRSQGCRREGYNQTQDHSEAIDSYLHQSLSDVDSLKNERDSLRSERDSLKNELDEKWSENRKLRSETETQRRLVDSLTIKLDQATIKIDSLASLGDQKKIEFDSLQKDLTHALDTVRTEG